VFLFPYKVDVEQERQPVANWAIIGATTASFLVFEYLIGTYPRALVLEGLSPLGMVGHVLLHAGWIHLAGNMIFLFVFGNAVAAKLGNLRYLGAYVLLALCAAFAHLLFDGDPAVGASGAVSGVMGLFLVLYPDNSVSCILVYPYMWRRGGGVFEARGMWMILYWTAFDIVGAFFGWGNTAYWAHLGGFAGGVALGLLLVETGWLARTPKDVFITDLVSDLLNPPVRRDRSSFGPVRRPLPSKYGRDRWKARDGGAEEREDEGPIPVPGMERPRNQRGFEPRDRTAAARKRPEPGPAEEA
jgi:membrane associated rhomboid family serine protease